MLKVFRGKDVLALNFGVGFHWGGVGFRFSCQSEFGVEFWRGILFCLGWAWAGPLGATELWVGRGLGRL